MGECFQIVSCCLGGIYIFLCTVGSHLMVPGIFGSQSD